MFQVKLPRFASGSAIFRQFGRSEEESDVYRPASITLSPKYYHVNIGSPSGASGRGYQEGGHTGRLRVLQKKSSSGDGNDVSGGAGVPVPLCCGGTTHSVFETGAREASERACQEEGNGCCEKIDRQCCGCFRA